MEYLKKMYNEIKNLQKKIDKKNRTILFFFYIFHKNFFIYYDFYTSTYKSGKLENTKKRIILNCTF